MKNILLLAALLLLPVAASAIDYDLTDGGTQVINGGTFSTTTIQTTGTGVIGPFLRLQNNGAEEGLNSDEGASDVLADTKVGIWTHDVQLKDIATVDQGGINYVGFLLDINQTLPGSEILFNKFDIYVNSASITDGQQDSINDLDQFIWGLDGNTLLLDYALNPGSGGGDLVILIPTSYFLGLGLTANDFLYVNAGFAGGNDGFEEVNLFGVLTPTLFNDPPPSVPENGTTVMLLGAALAGLGLISRRK